MGRVHRGTLKEGMNITLAKRDGSLIKSKNKRLHTFEGLGRKPDKCKFHREISVL